MSNGSKLVEDVSVVVPGSDGRWDGRVRLDGHLEWEGVNAGLERMGVRGGLLLARGCGRSEEGPVVMDEEMGVMM